MKDTGLTENYNKQPNDLHYVCDSPFEFCILSYLIRLKNGGNTLPFPSYGALTMGLMGRRKAITTVRALEQKGYIKRQLRGFNSNQYVIDIEKIRQDIRHNTPSKEANKHADREYSEEQKRAMTVRQAIKNPELAHKAETVLGNRVVDIQGEIIN